MLDKEELYNQTLDPTVQNKNIDKYKKYKVYEQDKELKIYLIKKG